MCKQIVLGLATVCVCLAWAGSLCAQEAVATDIPFPTQNEPVRVNVTDASGSPVAGAQVVVTYRPGSRVSREETVGQSNASGALDWTPSDAGLATITATWSGSGDTPTSATTTVSVRFQGAPLDGILIMIAAGLVLAVGSFVRIYKLLRAPEFN